ncbi:jg23830, partial [Pararge aegeria aegeria]
MAARLLLLAAAACALSEEPL